MPEVGLPLCSQKESKPPPGGRPSPVSVLPGSRLSSGEAWHGAIGPFYQQRALLTLLASPGCKDCLAFLIPVPVWALQ